MKNSKEQLKAKRLAFLEETAAFYNLGNRCFNESGLCQYFVGGKAGCAIGRHIQNKTLCRRLDKLEDGSIQAIHDEAFPIYQKLPEKLRELGIQFLVLMQDLHDEASYWDENGLSRSGKDRIKFIKQVIDRMD